MNGFTAVEDGTFFELKTRHPVKVSPPWKDTIEPSGNLKLFTLLIVCQGDDRVPGLLSLPEEDT
jgi:hypothetical protein